MALNVLTLNDYFLQENPYIKLTRKYSGVKFVTCYIKTFQNRVTKPGMRWNVVQDISKDIHIV